MERDVSAYRTDGTLTLSFTAEREDYRRAMGLGQALATGLAWVTPSWMLVCALLILHLPHPAGLIASGGLALFVGWLVWFAARHNWKRLAALVSDADRREQRYQLTDDAFEVHNRVSGKKIAWELVMHWRETDDDFLIYVNQGAAHLIPKRILADEETALRRILRQRVSADGEASLERHERAAHRNFATRVTVLIVSLGTLLEAIAMLAFG